MTHHNRSGFKVVVVSSYPVARQTFLVHALSVRENGTVEPVLLLHRYVHRPEASVKEVTLRIGQIDVESCSVV